jgi:hypothetical protein
MTPVAAFAFMACGATRLTLGVFSIKLSMITSVSFATLLVYARPLTFISLAMPACCKGGLRQHLISNILLPLLGRTILLLVMSWIKILSLTHSPYTQHAMLLQPSQVFATFRYHFQTLCTLFHIRI